MGQAHPSRGEWRCVDELSDKYYDRQGIRGTNFTEILRNVYGGKPKEGLGRFFAAFYEVRGDRVRQRLAPREVVEAHDPTPELPGGFSAACVIRFCELRGYPCYVIHNNVKIEEYYPPGYDTWDTHKKAETPRIMFCVWNGHALFYNREAANAIAHMHTGKPMYDEPFVLIW